MPDESMAQGKHTHYKCQEDHARLKPEIMDDIDPENRKSGEEERQNSTMHRAGDRCAYSDYVRVDLKFHE